MKTTGRRFAKKLNWTLAITFGCLAVSGLLWCTQKTYSQKVSEEKRRELINQRAKDEDVFFKSSSTDVPADPGNRIVAIRRIRFAFDDLDSRRKIFRNKKDLIEVEVFSKVSIPITDATQYLIIGDEMFPEPPRSGDSHTVFVHFTPEEFALLKDGAIVSYVISGGVLPADWLKELYKAGEPKQVAGAKFGRIDKSLIERFTVIEEDNDTQNLRISKTVNRVQ